MDNENEAKQHVATEWEPIAPPPLPDEVEISADRHERLGLPISTRDSLALILLTVWADICLFRASVWAGTGTAVLLIEASLALLFLRSEHLNRRALGLGVTILALSAIMMWSNWWLVTVLAVTSTLLLAVSLWRPDWNLLESYWAALVSIVMSPARLLGHILKGRDAADRRGRIPLPAKIVIIPAAISAVFIWIFASANPVVAHALGNMGSGIVDFLVDIGDYLSLRRVIFWCGWLLVFAALIRPVLCSGLIDEFMRWDHRLSRDKDAEGDESGFHVAWITLVCVNVIFLAYNGLDAVYLYFKTTLPDGITWTAYTHAGCGWLTLGLFASTVVLGWIFRSDLNFHPRSQLLKQTAAAWILLNAVLAVGTLRRISMYIDFSGLTHLRLTGVYGALLVISGLVIMAYKVAHNLNAFWLLRKYVAAFSIGLLLLALTPHGLVCARYNVPRILKGKAHAMRPVVLKEIHDDALPVMIRLLDYDREDGDQQKIKTVRQGIAAILGTRLNRLEYEEGLAKWQNWQGSSARALQALRPVREKIYATAPREKWHIARDRIQREYDVSGVRGMAR